MKKLFTIAIIMIILTGCAGGDKPTNTEYIAVISIPGKTKDELYVNAKTWFTSTFTSAGSVIYYKNKKTGRITGKFNFVHSLEANSFRVRSMVTIDLKNGKARVHFYDPTYALIANRDGLIKHDDSDYRQMDEKNMKATRVKWEYLEGELFTALTKI
jgi:major membrane immunogen (membrane-anchored lipoprotein)